MKKFKVSGDFLKHCLSRIYSSFDFRVYDVITRKVSIQSYLVYILLLLPMLLD